MNAQNRIAPMALLWALTLGLPIVLQFFFGPIPGVIAGMTLPVLWLFSMPSTYRSGGPLAATMALMQIGSGILWLLIGYAHAVENYLTWSGNNFWS